MGISFRTRLHAYVILNYVYILIVYYQQMHLMLILFNLKLILSAFVGNKQSIGIKMHGPTIKICPHIFLKLQHVYAYFLTVF
jgi:hypothetical protein